jgi:hypothetical protein
MKGIIVFYINVHPEHNQDITQVISVFKEVNKEMFARIEKDMEYQTMIVPCTKESCRVEKIDFDMPYPRYSLKSHFDLAKSGTKSQEETTKEMEELRRLNKGMARSSLQLKEPE